MKPDFVGELIGSQLSAVTFVMDYLQLWFDGPGINVYTPLTVVSGDQRITDGEPGFRDVLCAQIAKTVAALDLRPADAFAITFEDASCLSISLRPEDYTGPEAFYAHHFKDGSWVE
jgi:hypothetical protein